MRPARARACVVLLALVLGASGCKINSEDVDWWKGTVKGPGKIVAVMKSEKYDLPLRTHAALALVDMDRQDVDGIAQLQQTLQQLDPATRNAIIDGMAPGLEQMMRADSAAQGAPAEGQGAPPQQVRAKEAAYVIVPLASPATRERLVRAIVGWYSLDFNGRSLAGKYSAEQVIRALGSPAAAMLVDGINAKMPQAALVKIAELIGQLGDATTKQRAAERLVAMEREMESPAFVQWLQTRIQDQLRAQSAQGGAQVDANRVRTVAELNRESFINDGALPAMKFLASQPIVADRLLAIASTPSRDEQMVERRRRALSALEGNAKQTHLQPLLALALGENNPPEVRDEAFDRLGDIGSREFIPQMWPIVASSENPTLRGRAGELVLIAGGPAIVSEFLGRLPSSRDIAYAREELAGYAARMSQMSPPPTELMRRQLSSPNWWNRVIALRFFERRGTEADIPAMQRLTSDATVVKGPNWADGFTIGKVAEEAIAGMRERLAQGGTGGEEQAARAGGT